MVEEIIYFLFLTGTICLPTAAQSLLSLALYLLLVLGVMFLIFNLVSLSEVDYIKKDLDHGNYSFD